jgi:uncharacterized protein (AIM24 family)
MPADVIDYQVFGEEMQFVEVTLDPGEMVIAEAGGMMYMTSGIQMETVFGDPSKQQQGGFLGKLMSAGKRVLTGESLFMTTFFNNGRNREQVAFASPYPGKILPVELDQLGGELICQKDSFLCAARGVQVGIAFQKKFGVGLFGGEGFIMQRLTGDGIAMIHAGGTLLRRTLAPGEVLKVDTGCLVALMPSVRYDIQFVGGFKNTLFGGHAHRAGRGVAPVAPLLAARRAHPRRRPAARRQQGRRHDPRQGRQSAGRGQLLKCVLAPRSAFRGNGAGSARGSLPVSVPPAQGRWSRPGTLPACSRPRG